MRSGSRRALRGGRRGLRGGLAPRKRGTGRRGRSSERERGQGARPCEARDLGRRGRGWPTRWRRDTFSRPRWSRRGGRRDRSSVGALQRRPDETLKRGRCRGAVKDRVGSKGGRRGVSEGGRRRRARGGERRRRRRVRRRGDAQLGLALHPTTERLEVVLSRTLGKVSACELDEGVKGGDQALEGARELEIARELTIVVFRPRQRLVEADLEVALADSQDGRSETLKAREGEGGSERARQPGRVRSEDRGRGKDSRNGRGR